MTHVISSGISLATSHMAPAPGERVRSTRVR
jgi:hypothetical protein